MIEIDPNREGIRLGLLVPRIVPCSAPSSTPAISLTVSKSIFSRGPWLINPRSRAHYNMSAEATGEVDVRERRIKGWKSDGKPNLPSSLHNRSMGR